MNFLFFFFKNKNFEKSEPANDPLKIYIDEKKLGIHIEGQNEGKLRPAKSRRFRTKKKKKISSMENSN